MGKKGTKRKRSSITSKAGDEHGNSDSDNDDNGDDVREIIWLYYISFRIRESDS